MLSGFLSKSHNQIEFATIFLILILLTLAKLDVNLDTQYFWTNFQAVLNCSHADSDFDTVASLFSLQVLCFNI